LGRCDALDRARPRRLDTDLTLPGHSSPDGANMEPRYFEDWAVGDRIETLGRTVGDAEISAFVALGGFFEELFMSAEFAATKSPFKRRIAPGALTFAFAEGLIILTGCIHGIGLALVSVEQMNFRRPVCAGDTIRVVVEVADTRPTSRADRGLVTFSHTVMNQRDEIVMDCRVRRMLRTRAG
jgi:acyl dehydratase